MLDGFSFTVLLAALGVAVLHAVVGPDHYLPFVALARVRGWSRARTLGVTSICGLAHVASSLVLGAVVILAGSSLGVLESIEQGRSTLAAFVLLVFGLAYALYGARRASHGRAHDHAALHEHTGTTFWALFAVFVLGPCEPLIPLVFLPAAGGRWALAGVTAIVFGLATVATMVLMVAFAHAGAQRLPLGYLERWAHSAAGLVLALSGVTLLVGF
jgi:nickel/cobalt exporter